MSAAAAAATAAAAKVLPTLPSPLPPPPGLSLPSAKALPKYSAPVETESRSAGDYILMIINAVTVLLLLLGISFASVKVNDDGNTMFTPNILLTIFGFTVFFACISLWFSGIDTPKLVFILTTVTLIVSIFTISSTVIRMHKYA
jgi:uncharacterized membrane protein